MGFFSWKASDTNRGITNCHSGNGALPVSLLCPDGKVITESNYNGYGVFGGYDAYALLAKWNVPEKCTDDEEKDRGLGIDLECADEYPTNVKYPLKFVEDASIKYEDVEYSKHDPLQGFFDPCEDDEDNFLI